MAESVYLLCALASLACVILLWRGYRRSRARLLLWSSLCFIGLAANNILLFVDRVLVPGTNLAPFRSAAALAGLLLLLYGLIWDTNPEVGDAVQEFLLGANAMGASVIGLFFLHFWRRMRERLFLFFALAFWLLGLNWLVLAFVARDEPQTALYAVRLVAFGLIIAGIWDKNRRELPQPADAERR